MIKNSLKGNPLYNGEAKKMNTKIITTLATLPIPADRIAALRQKAATPIEEMAAGSR